MGNKVWELLKKNYYTEAGVTETEKMFDKFTEIANKLNQDDLKFIFNSINCHNSETFAILGYLANN